MRNDTPPAHMLQEGFQKKARSFSWASKFLGMDLASPIHRLYHFCRTIDDIMDETDDQEAAEAQLAAIAQDLRAGASDDPLVADFLTLSQRHAINCEAALYLIKGVRQDAHLKRYATMDELFLYCYCVGGTVGLMMSPLLGVTDKAAHAHAVDLGMAMQLTNIVRDVYEDAERGRVYLPEEILGRPISPEEILRGEPHTRRAVHHARTTLVHYAFSLYRSGDLGLRAIAPEHRLGIRVASYLYEAIGWKALDQASSSYEHRTSLSTLEKMHYTATAILWHHMAKLVNAPRLEQPQLRNRSHAALGCLPGLQRQ